MRPQYHVFNDITRPIASDSDDDKSELRHTLLFWEAFRAQKYQACIRKEHVAKSRTLGTVIIFEIR